MIDPCRQNNEVSLYNLDSDPFVISVPYIKITGPFLDQSDFLVAMDMLLKEYFKLKRNKDRWIEYLSFLNVVS